MPAAIEILGVSKRFRLYREARPRMLPERVATLKRTPYDDIWALRDIDLSVETGDTLGLLGHNGSGKSTLLKCIAGIFRPTKGRIRTAGRVAALLELGAGFHPELTGRENVFLNGTILGLSTREIERRFDEIVAFAELEAFIDNQVKHYSSGMYGRLGFAVAVNVEPDILLVDEVLAVGDEAFQRKCLRRVEQFQREGRTIVLVTHIAEQVREVCTRAAVLDGGQLVAVDVPGDAIRAFRMTLHEARPGPHEVEAPHHRPFRFDGVDVVYEHGRPHATSGEPVEIHVAFTTDEPLDDVVFTINVRDLKDTLLLTATSADRPGPVSLAAGRGRVVFTLAAVNLLDGGYRFSIVASDGVTGQEHERREQGDEFFVANPTQLEGLVYVPVEVRVDGAPS